MDPLRPNAQRARTAIALIWVVMAFDVAILVSSYMEHDLLSSWQAGTAISEEVAEANDARQLVIGLLRTAAFIISAVTFIQWFRRAYFNLGMRVKPLNESEGMAAGYWFIPIMNLFKPYRMMMELHGRTAELVAPMAPDPVRARSQDHITVWWVFWVASNIMGQVVFRVSGDANTIDELANSAVISMVDAALSLPLAILAVLVIKRYAALEQLLAAWKSPVDQFDEAGR
ncbi:MAG: DUF4328 domain-containing protein [Flavobacteriales bacterium]|nr:DUF4328 domain-containing protein [Flavobacteriales bacterium]